MGYLTTITIYNDSADQITNPKNADQIIDVLSKSMYGLQYDILNIKRLGKITYSIGNSTAIIAQQTRHADDTAIYIHSGNTLQCVSDTSVIKELMAMDDSHLDEILYELEQLQNKIIKMRSPKLK